MLLYVAYLIIVLECLSSINKLVLLSSYSQSSGIFHRYKWDCLIDWLMKPMVHFYLEYVHMLPMRPKDKKYLIWCLLTERQIAYDPEINRCKTQPNSGFLKEKWGHNSDPTGIQNGNDKSRKDMGTVYRSHFHGVRIFGLYYTAPCLLIERDMLAISLQSSWTLKL